MRPILPSARGAGRSSRLLLLLLPALCACDPPAAESARVEAPLAQPAADVLVTVNGVPITEADLLFQQRAVAHHTRSEPIPTPEWRKGVCETLIRRELFSQRAVQLGLDQDPEFRAKLAELEAQVADFRREQLGKLFVERALEQAQPSEAEVRQYFEQNAARLRSVVRIGQILTRDHGAILSALDELEAGVAFDELAARRFAAAPEQLANRPWELELRWFSVPPAWRDVVFDLAPGERSGILRDGDRFWIVQLLERREDPAIDFESCKAAIVNMLRNDRLQAVVSAAEQELRSRATITYTTPPLEEAQRH